MQKLILLKREEVLLNKLVEVVVNVTKKGQITISKELREKYAIKDKILMVEEEKGIRLKPLH